MCAQKGISEAIICPGSRSAPLTISFARHPEIRCRVISDERSAAYIALGIGQTTGQTVAIICTSGTAVLNLYPAISEAFYLNIPLLLLTADRPPEWVDQGNGQTIRQSKIFHNHVKKEYDLPVDYSHKDAIWFIERSLNEAIDLTQASPKGPVHINIPLREPLYPKKDTEIVFEKTTRNIQTLSTRSSLNPDDVKILESLLRKFRKKLIISGHNLPNQDLIDSLNSLQSIEPIPVLADVNSNLHDVKNTIFHSDSILAVDNESGFTTLRPELIITLGTDFISRNVKAYFRNFPAKVHIHVSESVDIYDPFQSITHKIKMAPADFFRLVAENPLFPNDKLYNQTWADQDQKYSENIQQFVQNEPIGEFQTVQNIIQSLPTKSLLHLSNSMSVRYANILSVKETKSKNIRIYANRGTSGIDGCTSTAVGAALSTDDLVVLITGDVAFFYDRNAFWNKYIPDNLRIVVLNNHGGVIFRLIDGPKALPELEEYFETTQQPYSIKETAQQHHINYKKIESLGDLLNHLPEFTNVKGKASIIEIETSGEDDESAFTRFKSSIHRNI